MKHRLLGLALQIGVAVAQWPATPVWSAPEQGVAQGIELPRRISRRPPPPAAPPELPARASELPPATFEWVVVWEGPDGARGSTTQSVVRTAERMLMVADGGASEWLFERNPVDTRRVSGYLVDHDRRRVLLHDDSDLRNRLGLRGWSDVLTLGFDPGALADLRATGEVRSAGGLAFERYVGPQPEAPGVVEVWWSDRLLAPLLLKVSDGGVLRTSRLERLDAHVQAAALADPRQRFPRYELLDVADAHDRER
jgi:hypothetical protein